MKTHKLKKRKLIIILTLIILITILFITKHKSNPNLKDQINNSTNFKNFKQKPKLKNTFKKNKTKTKISKLQTLNNSINEIKLIKDNESITNQITNTINNTKNILKSNQLKIKNWAYQLQNINPYEISKSNFKLIVIDYSKDGSEENKLTKKEIKKLKNSGKIPIAYISIGEAEDYRFYWKKEWQNNPPKWLGKENPNWESNYAVKYWNNEWKQILKIYLNKIIEQGFSGAYFDKVDEFEYWNENGFEKANKKELANRMINLIIELSNYTKTKTNNSFYIIPQNGENLLKYENRTILNYISGWAVEDVFYNGIQNWNEKEKEEINKERMPYLKYLLSNNKTILSVEYIDNNKDSHYKNKDIIEKYIKEAKKNGFIPYVAKSDRELDELNLIAGIQP